MAQAVAVTTLESIYQQVSLLNQQAHDLRHSDAQKALALSQQAYTLSLSIALDYPQALAESLCNLGQINLSLGEYEAAMSAALEALAICERLQDLPGQARVVEMLGSLYDLLGDYSRALQYHLQCLQLNEQIGNQVGQANILFRIGVLHSELGNYAQAVDYYSRALALYQQLQDRAGEARIMNSYCVDYTHLGAYDTALEYGYRGLALFQEIGDQYGVGVALSSIAETYTAAGDYDAAFERFQQALALLKKRGQSLASWESVETLRAIGELLIKRMQPELALDYLHQALRFASDSKDRHNEYACHRALADAYELQGDIARAFEHYKQYSTLKERVFNEGNVKKYQNLEVIHRTQQALADAARERKLREDERRHFEVVSQMKNEFVRLASHDLKNPLTIIINGLQMLRVQAQLDSQSQEIVVLIERAVGRMQDLISDMLEILKLETGYALTIRPFPLRLLITDVVAAFVSLAQAKGILLQSEFPPDEIVFPGDAAQIRRVLENLLSNAIKYTLAGGQVHVALVPGATEVQIQVQDTGLGIPAADLPRIFEQFYRVQSKAHQSIEGTGLGLAIVKAIVDQHRGRILVESQVDKGSVFTVILPLGAAAGSP